MTNDKRFQVGETYATRSACNYDCIYRFTVIKRTAKFLFLDDGHGNVERRGVYSFEDGVEHCKPNGTYSMCAIIDADGSLVTESGEITSEARNRAAREAREAAAPKPNPQLEGIGCKADETPISFANVDAETVVKVLIDAGFTPETLRNFTADRILSEYQAILRRSTFSFVAA